MYGASLLAEASQGVYEDVKPQLICCPQVKPAAHEQETFLSLPVKQAICSCREYVCFSSSAHQCKSGEDDLQGSGSPAAAPSALLLYGSHIMEERLQGCVTLALIIVHETHSAVPYMRSLQDSCLRWSPFCLLERETLPKCGRIVDPPLSECCAMIG